MNNTFTYAEAKAVLIEALEQDAQLHEDGQFKKLGARYDEVDARLPRGEGSDLTRLHFAFEFWSGWLDASEHDWRFYEPLKATDWPVHARAIATDLKHDTSTHNPVLTGLFSPRKRQPSFFVTLLGRVRGKHAG